MSPRYKKPMWTSDSYKLVRQGEYRRQKKAMSGATKWSKKTGCGYLGLLKSVALLARSGLPGIALLF